MTLSGPNPSIIGEAIRKAFNSGEDGAARRRRTVIERAALDEAELRELEQAQFYADAPAPRAAARKRSFLARILRR